jgi:hypothetical protein
VIVAVPADTPVTVPSSATRATPLLLDAKLTARPARVLPAASVTTAPSRTVPPTPTEVLSGVTRTAATGTARTVTVAVADWPSMAATIVAEPGAIPVTWPVDETTATPGSRDDHATTRPVMVAPAASVAVAVSCCVAPTVMDDVAGATATRATGTTDTTTAAVAATLPAAARTDPAPEASAVTSPSALTLTTAGVSLVHVIAVATGAPASLRARAVSRWREPTTSWRLVGSIRTAVIGRATTSTRATAVRPSTLAATCVVPTLRALMTPD